MKGKPWTAEEEKQLRELYEQGKHVNVIAATMNKSSQAIKRKIERLNLKVVGHGIHGTTTSRLSIPDDLPSVEEALKKSLNSGTEQETRINQPCCFASEIPQYRLRCTSS